LWVLRKVSDRHKDNIKIRNIIPRSHGVHGVGGKEDGELAMGFTPRTPRVF